MMNPFDKKTAVSLLPNMISMFNLFCGFLSLVMSAEGHTATAVWLIILALVWDSIDGNIARMFKVSTALGRELDSLSDIVSFVVAPAFLTGSVLLPKTGPWILLILFFYLGCGTYRLARFNARPTKSPHFQGLPSPACASLQVLFILNAVKMGWPEQIFFNPIAIFVMVGLSLMMVSNVVYPKLSSIPLAQWRGMLIMAVVMLAGGMLVGAAEAGLFGALLLFLLSPLLLRHILHAHEDEESHVPKASLR